MTTLEKFRARVEEFLAESRTKPTPFGLAACGDPNFVPDLRHGRKPNPDLMDRVDAYMREHGSRRAA